jgi:hypothetical protein
MKINAAAPKTTHSASHTTSHPLTKAAFDKLVSNISNKIGDGGPVDHLKVTAGKNGRVSFKGETFLGPGGGMVHFTGQADKTGKIVNFKAGEPQ